MHANCIVIPFAFENIDEGSISVIRYHGSAQELTKNPSSGNEGFVVDAANGTITIYAKKFSTYAISYYPEDYVPPVDPGRSDTGYSVLPAAYTVPYDLCKRDAKCPAAKFADVDLSAWYHDGIHFCVEKKYMNGISENIFQPKNTLSRAQIVMILWNMEGNPNVNYDMSFKDVIADAWYTEAIRWAQSTGVVLGYDAEHFGPGDDVTREQLAAILMRYAAFKGIDVSGRADLAKFTDADAISAWALENVKWANAVGIINGRTETTIVPTGNATRAEAACMVQRFCETVLK